MHSFFDLTYFREVGQKYRNIFVRFLVQMKTSKNHSEIIWPLTPYWLEYLVYIILPVPQKLCSPVAPLAWKHKFCWGRNAVSTLKSWYPLTLCWPKFHGIDQCRLQNVLKIDMKKRSYHVSFWPSYQRHEILSEGVKIDYTRIDGKSVLTPEVAEYTKKFELLHEYRQKYIFKIT